MSKMKQEPGSERMEMSPPLTLLRECLVPGRGSASRGPQKGRGGFLKAGQGGHQRDQLGGADTGVGLLTRARRERKSPREEARVPDAGLSFPVSRAIQGPLFWEAPLAQRTDPAVLLKYKKLLDRE